MDEQKDLSVSNEDVLDNNDSSVNDEVPNIEENADTSNVSDDVNKAGNGYRGLASSNREAFSRGLSDNYNERIARNQANLNASRARAASSHKMKEGHEDENMKANAHTGESNFEDKTKLDKIKDKGDVLRNKGELAASKIDKARAGMYAVTNPKEAAKMAIKAKIRTWILASIVPITIGCLSLFVLFVGVLFVLGLFEFESQASGGGSVAMGGKECGFTISKTSLSKSEYRQKLEEYSKIDSRAVIFYQNADNIYDLSVASNINPELVMVRAVVEGYSPGEYGKSGRLFNNYWGIGCYNDAGENACTSYTSFMDGVKGYVNNISQYSSLSHMMSKYAYIGSKWVEGDESSGGCHYFEHIQDYYDSSIEAQESKRNAAAACAAGGTGIPTTQYDQDAYATWQVKKKMAGVRETIFGLKFEEGVSCSYKSNEIVEAYVNWMIELAANNKHGYWMDSAKRLMNPDVDCSSFVYYGLLHGAGFSASELGGSYPFTTSSMGKILVKLGFRSYTFESEDQLVRGDIMWKNGHTEVYVGDGKLTGAHKNIDGEPGDSSGKEVDVDNFYNLKIDPWTHFYRYVGNN